MRSHVNALRAVRASTGGWGTVPRWLLRRNDWQMYPNELRLRLWLRKPNFIANTEWSRSIGSSF